MSLYFWRLQYNEVIVNGIIFCNHLKQKCIPTKIRIMTKSLTKTEVILLCLTTIFFSGKTGDMKLRIFHISLRSLVIRIMKGDASTLTSSPLTSFPADKMTPLYLPALLPILLPPLPKVSSNQPLCPSYLSTHLAISDPNMPHPLYSPPNNQSMDHGESTIIVTLCCTSMAPS